MSNASGDLPAGRLAGQLSELLAKLRRGSLAPGVAPDGVAAWRHAALPRLAASARLLPLAGRDDIPRDTVLISLGDAVLALVAALQSAEIVLPPRIDAALTSLAAALDQALARLDAGDSVAEVAADRSWSAVAAALGPSSGAPSPAPSPGPVLVLVQGQFRRAHVRRALSVVGRGICEVSDLPGAMAVLADDPAVMAAVCDNLEPTNHLRGLRRACRLDGRRAPPLVLMTSRRRPARAGADHASAVAIWRDPFAAEDLGRILAGCADALAAGPEPSAGT